MRLDKVGVLTRREYTSRIKTKGFWLSTLLVPVLFAVMAILPAVVMSTTVTEHTLVVVDETGRLAGPLARRLSGGGSGPAGAGAEVGGVRFDVRVVEPAPGEEAQERQRAALERQVLDEEIDAWLWIRPEELARNRVRYHAQSVSNFLTQEVISDALSSEVRKQRLEEAGIDPERVEELTRSVALETARVTVEGTRKETGFAGFALAYGLFFLLYLILIIYGQQVMNGVLEEKTSRAVEVVISSVKPFELMLGKLVGVGLVGLTQLAIWLVSLGLLTAPTVLSALAFLPPEVELPRLEPALGLHFAICFLLGYFLYAAFYAAIGSAFNNVQEAQQLASVAVIFLVAPMMLFVVVINDPDGAFAVVSSLIPPFTPLLMLLRIAVKTPPLWQIALGYTLTAATVALVVWLAARIYRVGILMVGKKPTVQELWRWLRYA